MQKIRLIEIDAENNGIADFLNVSGKVVKASGVEVSLTADFTALTKSAYWKGRELAVSGELIDVVNAVDFMSRCDVNPEPVETVKEQQKATVKPKSEKTTSGGYDKGGGKILGSSALKMLYPETGFIDFMRWLKIEDEDERHFRIGRALDARLCQNTVVKIFEIPEFDDDEKQFTRSNKGKAILKAKAGLGYICLDAADDVLVKNMEKAILEHPIAGMFFDRNNPHIKFQHVTSEPYFLENGQIVHLRKTRDMVFLDDPQDNSSVLFWCDLKSTCKRTHDDFNRQFEQMHYDIQAAAYNRDLPMLDKECKHEMLQAAGLDYPAFYVAVSSEPVHHVFISPLSDDVIKRGWEKCLIALKNLSDGNRKLEDGEYIGYTGIKKIGGFTQKKEEIELEVVNKRGSLF